MERASRFSDGAFRINIKGTSLFLIAFCGMVSFPAVYAEEWDSETFVKELDELRGDMALKHRFSEDKQWADYIAVLEPEYDERKFPEITTTNLLNHFFAQRLNFSLTGRGEVPFLAVIYQFRDGETELDHRAMEGVDKGHACGGVLVSADRLITNCACVSTYVASQIYSDNPVNYISKMDEPPAYKFDLGWRTSPGKYLFGGRLNRIYVQFGANRYFTGKYMPGVKDPTNDRHLTDMKTETGAQIAKYVKGTPCDRLVETDWHGGPPPPHLKSELKIQDNLALVPFHPPIEHTVSGQFVPWPPLEFSVQVSHIKRSRNPKAPREQVIVTGMGFKKYSNPINCKQPWVILDNDGKDISLQKIAINLPYLHRLDEVRDKETCRGTTGPEKYDKLSCFCDAYEPDTVGIEGCRTVGWGTLGWPIIYQGSVVALTASIRNVSTKGNVILGSSLAYFDFKNHVEKILTLERIHSLRTERPPMFREDLAPNDVVFYDFPERPEWFVHEGTTAKLIPFSLSIRVFPHWTVSFVTSLACLFTCLTSWNSL